MPVPVLALVLALSVGGSRTMRVPVATAETLAVHVQGAGTPVVLIPSLFGSAFGYRHVVEELADSGYGTYVVEPLGLGSSARPGDADYSLTAQAARIAAVLDTLGLRNVVLVGHSIGAAIAFRLALQRPDQVRAIVSIEGGPAESAVTAGFRRAMGFAPLLRLAGSGFVRHRLARELLAVSGDGGWVSDEVVAAYSAAAAKDLGGTLRAYRRMAAAHEPAALAPRIGQLRCPVHLLLGGVPHHGAPSGAEQEALRTSVASFTAESVPGAGHYLQEERPDVVVAAVRRYGRGASDTWR